ncbi:MAG: hypothetical protein OXG49_12800 [Chloroflexi bacterium]|nr:hypothetical protein [Chloroflexota bacterium]
MRKMKITGFLERLLFTAIVVGFLMAAGGAIRYFMLHNQLSTNMAAQIHEQGGEVAIESKGQAQGLMASDIERRRLVAEQFNMMIFGGVGLALLGLGWLGHDVMGSRRRKTAASAARSSGASS